MPLYSYACRACCLVEDRLAGIDDRTLICTECGEIMDRQISDEEAFTHYWGNPEADKVTKTG